jgi:hypothetical protein
MRLTKRKYDASWLNPLRPSFFRLWVLRKPLRQPGNLGVIDGNRLTDAFGSTKQPALLGCDCERRLFHFRKVSRFNMRSRRKISHDVIRIRTGVLRNRQMQRLGSLAVLIGLECRG